MFDRRDFLRVAGFAGLTLLTPGGRLFANEADTPRSATPYEGKFFVFVHAGGGWDPTSLCDPKGSLGAEDADPMNHYDRGTIRSAGNIHYAPVAGNQAFFDKHYDKLLVINGLDCSTNGHETGTRHVWSGNLSEGYPSIGAMIAGNVAGEQGLAYISNGGYDYTADLVAPTRLNDTGSVARIAFPNRILGNDPNYLFHHGSTAARIDAARAERREMLLGKNALPRIKEAMNSLHLARNGGNELRRLMGYLPETFDTSNNRLRRQAQVVCAAYKAGLTATANLTTGGFDTHSDHDNRQFAALQMLTEGVDFLWEEAERQGIADKMVVAVGSDFGRTPGYNDGNGKDHWSITSMMLMGAGIRGNRVLGGTTERHRPLTINPNTLALDEAGIRVKPGHIHRALRKLAEVEGSEASRLFNIDAEELDLFA
jgi:hypothetical protein